MNALQSFVEEMTGHGVSITRNMRIDQCFIETCGADSIEYLEISFKIAALFDVYLSNQDWAELAGGEKGLTTLEWEAKHAQHFTFGRLADLIAHRTKLPSLASVEIAGLSSRAAGAFRFIEDLAKRLYPKCPAFGPSTEILACFRGLKLRRFLLTLRHLTGVQIISARSEKAEELANRMIGPDGVLICLVVSFLALMYFAVRLGLFASGPFGLIFGGLVSFMVFGGGSAVLLLISSIGIRLIGPGLASRAKLPTANHTFGDLAEAIAGNRGGLCKSCGYDLTGVQNKLCPECGRPKVALPKVTDMIQRVAKSTHSSIKEFSSSTPILHRINGIKLETFWRVIQRESGQYLPCLPKFDPVVPVRLLFYSVGAVILTWIVFEFTRWLYKVNTLDIMPNERDHGPGTKVELLLAIPWIAVAAVGLLLFAYVAQFIMKRHGRRYSSLPCGIVTFDDLAIELSRNLINKSGNSAE